MRCMLGDVCDIYATAARRFRRYIPAVTFVLANPCCIWSGTSNLGIYSSIADAKGYRASTSEGY